MRARNANNHDQEIRGAERRGTELLATQKRWRWVVVSVNRCLTGHINHEQVENLFQTFAEATVLRQNQEEEEEEEV